MAFQDVRGKMGQEVISRTRGGLVAKRLPKYKYPKVAAVQQGADRMRQANAAWNELSLEQAQAWQAYAQTQSRVDPVTGHEYAMSAKSAFVALATRFLLASPGSTVPTEPPSEPFSGQNLRLTAAPTTGGMSFTASGINSQGVVTEIMMQTLPNVRRSPVKFYKSAAFHAFEPGSPQFILPLPPGVYAFAYRFLQTSTGLVAGERLLGVFEVA